MPYDSAIARPDESRQQCSGQNKMPQAKAGANRQIERRTTVNQDQPTEFTEWCTA